MSSGSASSNRVAVTTIAEFACVDGDLEGGGIVGPSARDGVRAHRRLQDRLRADDPSLTCEVAVERDFEHGGERWRIGGRIDLLHGTTRELGEIKSTLVPPSRLPEHRRARHRLQARLYAWCLAAESEPIERQVALHYVNLRDGAVETVRERIEPTRLAALAHDAIGSYLDWLIAERERKRRLRRALSTLAFPFPDFHAGQRTLAVAAYRAARDGTRLLTEAPTGIGKSVSALFPLLRRIGESGLDRIVWLTAKRSGAAPVLHAVRRLTVEGAVLNTVVLPARERSCHCLVGRVARDADGRCPLAIDFHARMADAWSELSNAGALDAARLEALADRHSLCPHGLATRALRSADIVVGDYNFVFDPLARLDALESFASGSALVIDEAHNLAARSRAMLTARLERHCLREAADATTSVARRRAWRALERDVLGSGRGLVPGEHELEGPPRTLARRVERTIAEVSDSLIDQSPLDERELQAFRAACRTAMVLGRMDDRYAALIEVRQRARGREVLVELLCLDAAADLEAVHRAYRSVHAMSATLAPMAHYQQALGLPDDTRLLRLGSPFDRSNALTITAPYVPVRWRERARGLDALVELIHLVSEARDGNYIAFFPSYTYLVTACERYRERYPSTTVWRQAVGDDDAVRDRRLAALLESKSSLGFAILGGVYGEGVDYVGDRLCGAIVVSVGLSPPGLRDALLIRHHDRAGRDGHATVAVWPGFARVQQSAGRVIRTSTDRGVIVLVDERFESRRYRALIPEHWCTERACTPAVVRRLLADFWEDERVSDVDGARRDT